MALAEQRQEMQEDKLASVAAAKAVAAEEAVERYSIARRAAEADKAEALWRGEDKGANRSKANPLPSNGRPAPVFEDDEGSVYEDDGPAQPPAHHPQKPGWYGVNEKVQKEPSPRAAKVADARQIASNFSRAGRMPKQKPDPVSATPRLPPVSPRDAPHDESGAS